MKNKILTLVLSILLMLQMSLVCASNEVQTSDALFEGEAVSEEAAVDIPNDETSVFGTLEKYIPAFCLVGAVVGAMFAVTLMYKKKDESRYL